MLAIEEWSDGFFLFGGRIVAGITSVLEMEAVVYFARLVMAGVAPTVCPKDLRHFVHGLLARAANQVFVTCSGKLTFAHGLCECSEESDFVIVVEFVEELVVVDLDAVEKFGPSTPRPIELGICATCSGVFSGCSCSRQFIQEIIVGGSGHMVKYGGTCSG